MSTSKQFEILIKSKDCVTNFCDWLVWKNKVEEIFAINQILKAFAKEILHIWPLLNKGQNCKMKFCEKYISEKYLSIR